jgi:hypothetical protein
MGIYKTALHLTLNLSLSLHLHPRTPPPQDRVVLWGIDVSSSRFFRHSTVLDAVQFASEAHAGQVVGGMDMCVCVSVSCSPVLILCAVKKAS